MDRRHFLKGVLGVGLGGAGAAGCGRRRRRSPLGKLRLACVGIGGVGKRDLENFRGHGDVEVAALCDVDRGILEAGAKDLPGANKYADWREMLASEGDRIDAVHIAVPDHMHAAIAMSAIRGGKHVYLQKPMCHDVAEVRALVAAAGRAGVATQLGTQHASGVGERMAVRYLREGVIGRLKHVYMCANREGAIERYRLPGPRPEKGEPPPADLAWELWLGTAPRREYAPKLYHPMLWRSWQDFGTGWSGDIGCHIFSALWMAYSPGPPKTVAAEVQESWRNDPARFGQTWPQSIHITWEFPGNAGTDGDFKVEWFDGLYFPPKEIQAMYPFEGATYPGEAAMFVGTDGALLLPLGSGPILLPREKFAGLPKPEVEPRNHYHHFVDSCFGRSEAGSNFGVTGPMSEAVLLGTVAVRMPGRSLEWDSRKMRFPNCREADRLLRRTYREGWAVKGLR
ncbi:MAG: Gfo/Idh/MocA family oxidoreductase [Verrucomicrobiae bacterium]|nr:Gfo/Idh/MocA family oxidoreductase [Verrucomicrobiae bacterium]